LTTWTLSTSARHGPDSTSGRSLADDIGCDGAVIARIEQGKRRLTIFDALALCGALTIDLRQLLAGIDDEAEDVRDRSAPLRDRP
jgi:transcriptional regulator with XRE-family HTH domain